MRIAYRPGSVVALVVMSLFLWPVAPFAQEGGRPAFVHDHSGDARASVRSDNGRNGTDQGQRGGLDGLKESRARPLTEVEKAAHESDLTKGKDAEFHDLAALSAEIKTDEARTQNQDKDGRARADQLSAELIERRNEKGNYGLGSATHADAERLGREWVGDDARLSSDGKALVSKDGLRQYRPPSFKPDLGREQANYEKRLEPDGKWTSNGHLDITP